MIYCLNKQFTLNSNGLKIPKDVQGCLVKRQQNSLKISGQNSVLSSPLSCVFPFLLIHRKGGNIHTYNVLISRKKQ